MTPNERVPSPAQPPEPHRAGDAEDDVAEIRYSLTALGEAALAEDRTTRGELFRGFGPCGAVA
jgi:hypothetical protein